MDASLQKILGIRTPAPAPAPRPVATAWTGKPVDVMTRVYKEFRLHVTVETANPQVLDFHEKAIAIIEEESRAAAEAIRNVSSDLKHEVLAARQAGIMRMAALALGVRLAKAAEPLAMTIYKARQIIDKAMNRQPAEPMAGSLWFAKVADMRRQLEGMTNQERMTACKELANRADEVWPAVFLDSLRKYVPEQVAVAFSAVYQEAYAGDQFPLIEAAEDGLVEVKAVIQNAELALEAACSGTGLASNWKSFTTAEIVKAWPKPAKAAFIAAKGEAAYAALLDPNTGDLRSALSLFRPGLEG